ncbi:MAG TPA: HDOD domain-containing protein [Desulfobacterales bacterium]|nr:HDOD domain-containing protein [Desulfobacterales bacterium]
MTRTITITSGKGGAGKTSTSVNLALHLATLGYRTCLFDADLGLANVNVLLGLYPEYNLEDVILYHHNIEDIIIRDYKGIDIIPGSSGVERIANLEADQVEHLIESFSALEGYDFLLFDTSAGVSKNVISFCLASSEVIVVIAPEVTSLTDAYALLKILCLNGFKGSVRIVVNQCKSTAMARQAYTKFKETVKKYLSIDVVPLGIIVQDSKVEEAVKDQQAFVLLYPESNAAKCIKSIAKRLREERPEDLESHRMLSFWTTYHELITSPLKLTATKKEKKEIIDDASSQACQEGPPQEIRAPGNKGVPDAPKDVLQHENREHIFKQIVPFNNLPALPHVVLKLIESCNGDESTIQDISQIVNKDASLSANVMSMASSTPNGPDNRVTDVNEAVSLLGKDAVKTIAIRASEHFDFDQDTARSVLDLKLFWRHSLMCANLAELIAKKTSYPAPDEAYLSGLLHDIGKLVLCLSFPEEYAEILRSYMDKPDLLLEGEMHLGATHYQVGAWMINRWNPQSFLADAVLYHHEPVHSILDAFPLVKVVFVANSLDSETAEKTGTKFKTAEEVFGFARSEAEELISLAKEEVNRAAKSLDIDIDPPGPPERSLSEKDTEKRKDVARAVRDISLLQSTFKNLLETYREESILKVLKQGIQLLFNIQSVLFFLCDREKDLLVGRGLAGNKKNDLINDLAIPLQKAKSLLTRSLRQETVLDSLSDSTRADTPIMDKQLIRFLGRDGMLCLPMVVHKAHIGVIVLGTDEHHISYLRNQGKLLAAFANQAALALAANRLRQSETAGPKDVIKKIKEILNNSVDGSQSRPNLS